jgi:hypothetical protein
MKLLVLLDKFGIAVMKIIEFSERHPKSFLLFAVFVNWVCIQIIAVIFGQLEYFGGPKLGMAMIVILPFALLVLFFQVLGARVLFRLCGRKLW